MNITDTAYWAAACRAVESRHPYPLFVDPMARHLAGDRGMKLMDIPGAEDVLLGTTVRTMLMDQMIMRLILDPSAGIDAVLNLGSGLDARPYRLPQPASLAWIEADVPELVEYMNRFPGVYRLPVDLTDPDATAELLDMVGSRWHRVLVITEGVMQYLTPIRMEGLALSLASRPLFQWWLTDVISSDHARRLSGVLQGSMPVSSTSGVFGRWGWAEVEYRSITEEALRVSRGIRFHTDARRVEGMCHAPRVSGVAMLKYNQVSHA